MISARSSKRSCAERPYARGNKCGDLRGLLVANLFAKDRPLEANEDASTI